MKFRLLYDYPFFFIFSAVLAFAAYKEHFSSFVVFLIIAAISIFRARVFLFCLIFVVCVYCSSAIIYNTKPVNDKKPIKGRIYDIRKSKRLTIYIKTDKAKLSIFASKLYDNLNSGDRVLVKAHLMPISNIKNSRYRQYLYVNNVQYIGYAVKIEKLSSSFFYNRLEHIKQTIEREFYYFLNKDSFIFLQNAVLGNPINKAYIKKIFIDTQTAHIMSVSGMHMGFVFGLFYIFFYKIISYIPFIYRRYNLKTTASTFSIFPVFFYFLISGMHIPAIRSFLMLFVFIATLIYGWNKTSYNILFLIASVLAILFGYRVVFNASFVLSFFMSFAAIYTYSFVKALNINSKISSYAVFSLLMSIAAYPLSMYYFHKFSYVAILGNMVMVPFFGLLIMPLSFISIFLSFLNIYYLKLISFSVLSLVSDLFLNIIGFLSRFKPVNINIDIYVVVFLYMIIFITMHGYSKITSTSSK